MVMNEPPGKWGSRGEGCRASRDDAKCRRPAWQPDMGAAWYPSSRAWAWRCRSPCWRCRAGCPSSA